VVAYQQSNLNMMQSSESGLPSLSCGELFQWNLFVDNTDQPVQ